MSMFVLSGRCGLKISAKAKQSLNLYLIKIECSLLTLTEDHEILEVLYFSSEI